MNRTKILAQLRDSSTISILPRWARDLFVEAAYYIEESDADRVNPYRDELHALASLARVNGAYNDRIDPKVLSQGIAEKINVQNN